MLSTFTCFVQWYLAVMRQSSQIHLSFLNSNLYDGGRIFMPYTSEISLIFPYKLLHSSSFESLTITFISYLRNVFITSNYYELHIVIHSFLHDSMFFSWYRMPLSGIVMLSFCLEKQGLHLASKNKDVLCITWLMKVTLQDISSS